MQSAFESWVGQHVLVRLTLGETKVSLRGTLLKDRMDTLLMGPEFGSELEIPKKIILAIEEVGAARLPAMLASFGSSARSARIKNTISRRDSVGTTAFKFHRIVRVQKSPRSEAVLNRESCKAICTRAVGECREELANQNFALLLSKAGIASLRSSALRYAPDGQEHSPGQPSKKRT